MPDGEWADDEDVGETATVSGWSEEERDPEEFERASVMYVRRAVAGKIRM